MARKRHRHQQHRPRIRRSSRPGTVPGTLNAAQDSRPSVLHVMGYDAHDFGEATLQSVDELRPFSQRFAYCWINVDGLANTELVRRLGELFGLHALALEDVVNVHQRAKVEPFTSHLFVVARMVSLANDLQSEQVSMFVGANYLLTFQDLPGDCFDPVRERLRKNSGRIRSSGPDYLMYALLDAVIDSYFPVVDAFVERLDQLEVGINNSRTSDAIDGIHAVRNELLLIRRFIRPHRDAVAELIRDAHPAITEETRIALRDCYDHTMQLIDLLETYREMCGDLRDYYLSLASNRMNEVMKLLTIISTIFMPLSFVAGLYGMNFTGDSPWAMPELHWKFGYPFALLLMAAITVLLVGYFYRKGWLNTDGQV